MQVTGENSASHAAQKPAEKGKNKPEVIRKAPEKADNPYAKRELRNFRGVLENAQGPVETFRLNKSTLATYETVLFREYKYVEGKIKANPALRPVIEKVRTGKPLAAIDRHNLRAAGFDANHLDQFLFYVDFTLEGGKLDDDHAILTHAGDYLKREDRLLRANQIAITQLKALQLAARAEVVNVQKRGKQQPYEDAGPFIYDGEGNPVTLQDLNKGKSRLKRMLQGLFDPNSPDALLRKGVKSRDAIQAQIDKADHNLYYMGVKFFDGKKQLVTKGPIKLNAQDDYTKSLLQIKGMQGQLQGTGEMQMYAKLITDIVHARVDLYASNLDKVDWNLINPKVYDLNLDPANPGQLKADKLRQNAIFDIEAQKPNFTQQKSELQKRVLAKTREELAKKQVEKAKKEKDATLTKQVDKWSAELKSVTPLKQKEIDDEKKTKQDDIDKKNEVKAKSQKKEDLEKKQKDTDDQLNDIEKRTGLKRNEIENYHKVKGEIRDKEDEIAVEEESIDRWQKELDGKKIPLIPNVNPQLPPTPDVNSAAYKRSEILNGNIANANDRINGYRLNIRKSKADIVKIVDPHRKSGLNEQQLEDAYQLWLDNKQAGNDIQGMKNLITDAVYNGLPRSEDIQKEIDKLQKEKDSIGVDRVEDRVVELLEVFKPMIGDETPRNQRIQLHMGGELQGIPNSPHLADYPRPYLRTLQILFGEDIVNLENESAFKQKTKLFTPDDFVRLAGQPGMIANMAATDPRWNQEQDILVQRIDDRFITSIMDDLESRVMKKTLGLSPAERKAYSENVSIRNTRETNPMDPTLRKTVIARPRFQNSLPSDAKKYYYYESIDDLARRMMIDRGVDTLDVVNQKWWIVRAEEIDRYRKENPNV